MTVVRKSVLPLVVAALSLALVQPAPLQADPQPAAPVAQPPAASSAAAPAPAQAAPAAAQGVPPSLASPTPGEIGGPNYSQDETLAAAEKFFGGTSEGLAKAIEKAFHELGEPDAYIEGSEGSGAFFVGLRYGEGHLYYKGGGATKIYWQGPSVGFDWGGNASKVFTLVYNLHWTRDLYQRFPGVDGSLYVVAGVGLNYQRASDITLAPIRTGVGLRAGASVGYLAYTRTQSWIPF